MKKLNKSALCNPMQGAFLYPKYPRCTGLNCTPQSEDAPKSQLALERIKKKGGREWDELQRKYRAAGVDKAGESGIINTVSDKVTINAIGTPIEQRNTSKGNPNAILHFNVELNNRQNKILKQLPEYDSRITVDKKTVCIKDLAALTAKTGDEFTMFTRGNERLIIRGNSNSVNVDIEQARLFSKEGYRWSGHTHPGTDINTLMPSTGDKEILKCFKQEISAIYNSKGNFATFGKE